jgi:hypothetical protein
LGSMRTSLVSSAGPNDPDDFLASGTSSSTTWWMVGSPSKAMIAEANSHHSMSH